MGLIHCIGPNHLFALFLRLVRPAAYFASLRRYVHIAVKWMCWTGQSHYEMILSASPPRPTASPGYEASLNGPGGHGADRLTLDDVDPSSPPPAYTVLDVGPRPSVPPPQPPPPPTTQTTPTTPDHTRRTLATSGNCHRNWSLLGNLANSSVTLVKWNEIAVI